MLIAQLLSFFSSPDLFLGEITEKPKRLKFEVRSDWVLGVGEGRNYITLESLLSLVLRFAM